ncbi:MAG TPA: hypothetical protein VKN82_04150 [Desulfohalobiaceae bacterium]|nr:hypothetical protein [Desulfohalobiaceae bacterium]
MKMVSYNKNILLTPIGQITVICCLGLFFLSSCAGTKDQMEGLAKFTKAKTLWEQFQSSEQNYLVQTKAISVQGSFQYSSRQQRHRLKLNLWGDLAGPFRINLQTGFGQIFSLWRVDSNSTSAFYPNEQKVFVSNDPQKTMLISLGIHFPLSFLDLPYILTSGLSKIVPEDYQQKQKIPQKGWLYKFEKDQSIQSIVIGFKGQVLQIGGTTPFFWHINFDDFTVIKDHLLGQKIVLENEFKERLILHLDKLELRDKLWPPQALQLNLPENIEHIYL